MKYLNGLLIILLLTTSSVSYAQNQIKPANTKITANDVTQSNNSSKQNPLNNATKINKNDKEHTLNDYIQENNNDNDEDILKNNDKQQDPYEKFNRAMFQFNEDFDHLILKPVAKIYNALLPAPVDTAIDNIFGNLAEIATVVNNLLQFNFYQATSGSWRFAINSTVGLGGILDVAEKTGLNKHYEDVGLTLAKWGWNDSNYFVIPFLGSSTIRDGLGLIPYYYMTIYPYIKDWRWRYAALTWRAIDIRARLLRFDKVYEEAAIDRYVFVKSAYLQRRKYLIEQNKNLKDPYTAEDTQKAAANDNEEIYYLEDV